jgi:hypothetical protein
MSLQNRIRLGSFAPLPWSLIGPRRRNLWVFDTFERRLEARVAQTTGKRYAVRDDQFGAWPQCVDSMSLRANMSVKRRQSMDHALQLVIEMNQWIWSRFKDDL